MRAHPVGLQIQHLLLELVLHVPTRTGKLLIQARRTKALPVFAPKPLPRQVGHDEPGIVATGHHLGLAHHPARAAPTLAGLILQILELPRTRGSSQTPPPARRGQGVLNHPNQPRIRPQSQAIIHHRLLRLTPRHNLFPPKGATRFLILPWVKVPHLASHLLARVARRIAADWQALYEHPVYLLETFIDPKRFAGTCYRAANWIYLGLTTGRGKDDQTNRPNRSLKQLLAYPLQPDFRRRLCGEGCG